MTRSLLPVTAAAAAQPVVRPVLLARLDFASGPVCVTSAPFDLILNDETYLGVGTLGGVSTVAEGAELQSYAISLSLSGIPPELVQLALSDPAQGRDARLWLLLLDEDHRAVGQAVLLFRGRIDTMTVALGSMATITLGVQSRLADWERPRVRRYTHEDQKAEYPADRGFEFIAQMAEKTIYWGR